MEWQFKLELTTEAIHQHFINVCVAIDRMLNCDGEVNANVKCEQALKHDNHRLLSLQWPVIRLISENFMVLRINRHSVFWTVISFYKFSYACTL